MASSNLPGTKRAFSLKAGEGDRYIFGSQLATVLARNIDTGGLFESVVYSGGKGTYFPLHRHAQAHEAIIVLSGRLILHLDGNDFLLLPGDYASIPAGIVHGHRFLSHHTTVSTWTIGGIVADMFPILGSPYNGYVHPAPSVFDIEPARFSKASAVADVDFVSPSPWQPGNFEECGTGRLPNDIVPFTLQAGEGDCRIAGSTIFNMLTRQRNSGGKFIAVMAEGPMRSRVPFHYHEHHTENFLCMDGVLRMWSDNEEVVLGPGDYLHVPAGTVHSYQQDSHYTRFLGILVPGLFEAFFDAFSEPYAQHIFPLEPGPFRYDRVSAIIGELDVKEVESFASADQRMHLSRGNSN